MTMHGQNHIKQITVSTDVLVWVKHGTGRKNEILLVVRHTVKSSI